MWYSNLGPNDVKRMRHPQCKQECQVSGQPAAAGFRVVGRRGGRLRGRLEASSRPGMRCGLTGPSFGVPVVGAGLGRRWDKRLCPGSAPHGAWRQRGPLRTHAALAQRRWRRLGPVVHLTKAARGGLWGGPLLSEGVPGSPSTALAHSHPLLALRRSLRRPHLVLFQASVPGALSLVRYRMIQYRNPSPPL